MTYGFRCYNNNGIISVDEDSTSYVYLGKTQITTSGDFYINCVGYPMVFFGVPYNVEAPGNGATGRWNDLNARAGIAMTRLRQTNSNTWIVTLACTIPNVQSLGLYIRVFGLLHLNFPNGSGQSYGARARDSQGRLIFDTGCRQLRLAGNSYDTEMIVSSRLPDEVSEPATVGDTAVGLPFSLANKSIMANTRGTAVYPYTTGEYIDSDTGQTTRYYTWLYIESVFWASGNSLYSRKAATGSINVERGGTIDVITSNIPLYTRVAVIDNNLFP